MNANAAVFGWGLDEQSLINSTAAHNLFVHASDWAINLSTLTNFIPPEFHQPAKEEPKEKRPSRRHTVTFVFTDGDNIQWLLSGFASNTSWYASPQRGSANVGWTVSAGLVEIAPTVLEYLYRNAANNTYGKDYFIAGPSGLGYTYPDLYSDLDTFANLTAEFMKASDLSILNILGLQYSKAFVEPFLQYDSIQGIFYYEWIYDNLNGQIFWVNNKPVIGARFLLWSGFDTPLSLANKLNVMSTDIHRSEGYSLVAVHAWSMQYSDILECISLLDRHVDVVTPGTFVDLIQSNLEHR